MNDDLKLADKHLNRIEQWNDDIYGLMLNEANDLCQAVKRLSAENDALREGLAFYADGENYQEHTTHSGEPLGTFNILEDHGERARKLLEE